MLRDKEFSASALIQAGVECPYGSDGSAAVTTEGERINPWLMSTSRHINFSAMD